MSTAETINTSSGPLPWDEICALYPQQWVCLVDIVRDEEGVLQAARVVAHHSAIERALDQFELIDVETGIIHTAGIPLSRTPRIVELVDVDREGSQPLGSLRGDGAGPMRGSSSG